MKRFLVLAALLTAATAAGAATTYTYDELNRLTKAVYDDGRSISYTYDAAGNLLGTTQSAATWCGQLLGFDNNQLPVNWSSFLVRGGPGLRNSRMEAAPTDSGVVVSSTSSPMAAAVRTVVVEFNNARTYSYWGQINGLEFKTAAGLYWYFDDVNAAASGSNRQFRSFRSTQPFGSAVAGEVTFMQQTTAALALGTFRTRLTLRDGLAQWLITDTAGQPTTVSMPLAPEFKVAELVAAAVVAYTTTDGATWIDDVALQCQP